MLPYQHIYVTKDIKMNKRMKLTQRVLRVKDTVIFTGMLLIAPLLLSTVVEASRATECIIHLAKATKKSKTYYLNSLETLSHSVMQKLIGNCTVKTRILSSKEYRVIKIRRLNAQILNLSKE